MHYVLTGRDVGKINGLLRQKFGDGSAAKLPRTAFDNLYPPLWTVRWFASESYAQVSDESPATGAWCVWLGDATKALYNGAYMTVTGVTPAEHLGEGWFKIDDGEEMSGTEGLVALCLHTGVVSVVGSASDLSSTQVLIAWIDTNTSSGRKTVKQFVEGAIVLDRGGCWTIIYSETQATDETTGDLVTIIRHVFGNQFYLDGESIMQELALTDAVEDFVGLGEAAEGEEYSSSDLPYVCLAVPATTNHGSNAPRLVGYASLSDMQDAQRDMAWVTKPLYKFRRDGSVAVDFRNMPNMQMAEAL